MKNKLEVNKIKAIMSSGKPQGFDDSLDYSFDEKCTAIINWAQKSDVDFDTKFVEDVAAKSARFGQATQGQTRAINNIIKRYKINVSGWSY